MVRTSVVGAVALGVSTFPRSSLPNRRHLLLFTKDTVRTSVAGSTPVGGRTAGGSIPLVKREGFGAQLHGVAGNPPEVFDDRRKDKEGGNN